LTLWILGEPLQLIAGAVSEHASNVRQRRSGSQLILQISQKFKVVIYPKFDRVVVGCA
jgi:hypothetical protein